MLSVVDLLEVVGAAESLAEQHAFTELAEYLELRPDAVDADPTLQYLAAYSAYMTGREPEARSRLTELERDAQVNRYERLYRRILNLRAIVAVDAGDLIQAVALLDELEGLAWSANDHRYVAYATLNRGIAMEITGDAAAAVSAIDRARLAFQRLGDQVSLAACAHNLAMAHRTLGQLGLAESLFELAADTFAKLNCSEERLTAQIELAHCISLDGDHGRAEARAVGCIAVARAQDNPRLIAEAQRVLGTLYRKMGRIVDALPLLNGALQLADEAELRLLRCEIQIELARAAIAQGDVRSGKHLLGAVAATFSLMGAPLRANQIEQLADSF